jgi:ATP-dependent Clp protease, protease subunit
MIGNNSKKRKKSKKAKQEEEPTEEEVSAAAALASMVMEQSQGQEIRTIALFDDLEQEVAAEIVVGMMLMAKRSAEPIDFWMSTYGGGADDMFSIYDMMNHVKENCEIHTFALGKVMSAGVLLLAAGTKGRRKIGKHCRIMIHSCNAGHAGAIHNLQNEMDAIRDLQDKYIEAMVAETSLTKRQLKKLLDRKVNVYLTAEEAIEYGIVDEII